jgi:predicted nucleic acid-binding Zn ribbon protein
MYCENCGKRIDINSKFCNRCGAEVKAKKISNDLINPLFYVLLISLIAFAVFICTRKYSDTAKEDPKLKSINDNAYKSPSPNFGKNTDLIH